MGALADRFDGRFRRSDKTHDLRVAQLGMMPQEPQYGVRRSWRRETGVYFGARFERISGMKTFERASFSR